ncbi:MAG TPA: hypothetical protein VKI65_05890, partial [Gemmataceae bacterium]|nr:hypothetical protein [Gemmataceae bacterium]
RLHAGWTNRRRQAADRVRAEQAAGEELRREWAALREEWLRRRAVLQQEERALAERTLALEQYRQGLLAQAPDPAAADKELRRLRRQWGTQFASTTETIRTEQQALHAEAGRLELRYREVQQQVEGVTAEEADVYRRQLTFERDQTLAADEYNKLRQELVSLYAQRTCYERQVLNLQDEVERIACLLLDETDAGSPPAVQAA